LTVESSYFDLIESNKLKIFSWKRSAQESSTIGGIGHCDCPIGGTTDGDDQKEMNLKPETAENSLDRHRLPLPLELNCQIFECLKVPIQKKFICGLGRGIYEIFRKKSPQKGLIKNHFSINFNANFRAKDSAILRRMAGIIRTQMP
jgi:hypothetical protein